MKCPKCEYLGFDTGDRCKNCGYEFSLLSFGAPLPDVDLRNRDDLPPAADVWLRPPDDENAGASPMDLPAMPAVTLEAAPAAEPPLPLFTRRGVADDEPLVRVPAVPRPPLAVRRTPDAPRLRSVRTARPSQDLSFEFAEEPVGAPGAIVTPANEQAPRVAAAPLSSGGGRRLAAAAIDHAILLTIDLVVVYFTLKIAALTLADWRLLPMAPLFAFLLLLKFAYFSAFTAVGGQTIGKMGAGIRVVADDGGLIDAACAVRRSLAGSLSLATLGATFAPALIGEDRRALHDRVAHTRVVTR
jgi:uncharacterized RDD family membrane protein YckC